MKIIDKIRNLSTSEKYLCIIIAIAITITVCIVVKCKIDKATNRVTWANFYTPYTIDAVMTIIVDLSTTVVMSYERDYTITY